MDPPCPAGPGRCAMPLCFQFIREQCDRAKFKVALEHVLHELGSLGLDHQFTLDHVAAGLECAFIAAISTAARCAPKLPSIQSLRFGVGQALRHPLISPKK